MIAIAAAGLVAADIATYTALKSFLIDRVDSTLNAVHQGVESVLLPGRAPAAAGAARTAGTSRRCFSQIPGYCIEHAALERRRGRRPRSASRSSGSRQPAPGAKLPTTITLPADSNTPEGDRVRFFTVPAVSGGGSYRVRASIEARDPTHVLLIAAPLTDVDSTLHRLFLIELGVTVAVLATMILLGLWIVRLGLRPLEAMGKTADAIAAGDLSRRVEPAEERTEVGRLGLALNSMLAAHRGARSPSATRPCGRSRRPRASCGASSPTPRTSCGRRSPPSAPTPSSSPAARRSGPTTSSGR